MTRKVLEDARVHPAIRASMGTRHASILHEVEQAIATNEIVVVGMAMNPFPLKARRLLKRAGLPYKYLEYGSYLSSWRRRNALKMWAGWPTFPMVFIQGVLIGGASELEALLESGELQPRTKG